MKTILLSFFCFALSVQPAYATDKIFKDNFKFSMMFEHIKSYSSSDVIDVILTLENVSNNDLTYKINSGSGYSALKFDVYNGKGFHYH